MKNDGIYGNIELLLAKDRFGELRLSREAPMDVDVRNKPGRAASGLTPDGCFLTLDTSRTPPETKPDAATSVSVTEGGKQ